MVYLQNRRLVRRTLIDKLSVQIEKGTPKEVLIRQLLHQTGCAMSTAYSILKEAELRADPKAHRGEGW